MRLALCGGDAPATVAGVQGRMTALKAVLLAATLLLPLGGDIAAAAEVDLDRWQRLSTRGVEQANAGRLEEAEESLRAVALASGLRETDPRGATTANNLGFVLHASGRPEAAIPLYRKRCACGRRHSGPSTRPWRRASTTWPRPCGHSAGHPRRCPCTGGALAIRRTSLGAGHPETAQSLNNLSVLLGGLGEQVEAQALAGEALKVRLEAFGPDHPRRRDPGQPRGPGLWARRHGRRAPLPGSAGGGGAVAATPRLALTLSNLAQTLSRQQRAAEALPLFERALAIRTGQVGEESLAAAQSRRDLAATAAETGDLERAQALLEASLATQERLLGQDATLTDLAEVHRRQGDLDEAAPLLARALATEERQGEETPGLATMLNNLAALHYRRGAYRDALPLLARALRLEEQAHGPDYPELAVTLDNYAAVLTELARPAEAEAARHRADAIRLTRHAGRRRARSRAPLTLRRRASSASRHPRSRSSPPSSWHGPSTGRRRSRPSRPAWRSA